MKLELKDTMYDHRIDAPPPKKNLYNVAHFVSTSDLLCREVLQISNNYPNTFCVIIPNTFCVIIMIIDGTLYPIQDKSISMSVAFYRLYLPRARLIVECTQCPARSHTSMKKLVLIHTCMYKIKVHKLLEIWIIPSM